MRRLKNWPDDRNLAYFTEALDGNSPLLTLKELAIDLSAIDVLWAI